MLTSKQGYFSSSEQNVCPQSEQPYALYNWFTEKVIHGNGPVIRSLTAFKSEQKRESDFLVLSKHGSITGIIDWCLFWESQKQFLTFLIAKVPITKKKTSLISSTPFDTTIFIGKKSDSNCLKKVNKE